MRTIEASRPELTTYTDYVREIKDIFETGILTNEGSKVQRFQRILKERTNCDNVELFINGHAALYLGISSIDLPKEGEVLTSPFTFISTTNAILQNGLIPVFCDIDTTYNISLKSMEDNVTDKTCAIITPHIFGIPCDVNRIEKFAKEHNLKVVYDAAQAFGTKIGGQDIATFGDIAMFSFHAIKVFNSIEGGVLCYKDSSITRRLKESKNFGLCIDDKMDAEFVGINAKMDEFRAAMGLVNIRNVDETIKKRKKLAEYYCDKLSYIDGIDTYEYKAGIDYNYAYFPIKIDIEKIGKSSDQICKILGEKGIGTRRLYSRLTCDYKSINKRGYRCDVPNAKMMVDCCLNLPIYSSLEIDDINYIVDTIVSIL